MSERALRIAGRCAVVATVSTVAYIVLDMLFRATGWEPFRTLPGWINATAVYWLFPSVRPWEPQASEPTPKGGGE
jgi:hypothetical protein